MIEAQGAVVRIVSWGWSVVGGYNFTIFGRGLASLTLLLTKTRRAEFPTARAGVNV